MRKLPSISTRVFYPLVLGVLVVLAYFPTLTGAFILDDRPLIQNNSYVKAPQTPISYLSQEDGAGTGYYRPLINFTYWLDYKIWGMNGAGFRTSNLFYHLSACILFFFVLRNLTGDWYGSFWIAALFAVHPVNTEAVSWVSSRNNILVAVFGLASFHLYLKANEKSRAGYASLSLLFFAGALLSKEFGLILLPIFFLWTLFVSQRSSTVSFFLRNHLPFVIIVCVYILIRFSVTAIHASSAGDEPLWQRVFLAPHLILLNTGMILVPLNLHNFIVRYPTGVFPWQGILGLLFLVFVCLLFRLYKGRSVFRFGIGSFILSLLPILNIISIPSPSLVSMRWLYFPMMFLLIGVSPFILLLLRRRRLLTTLLLCILTGCFSLYTHILNRNLWHDEKTFFTQEVARFKSHYYSSGLAEILYQEGDYKGAEEQFAVAFREGLATAKDMINYGALLIDQGRSDAALDVLQRAKEHPMSFEERAELHNNLGMASFHQNRPAEAIIHFKKAVVYFPQRMLFWSNLAGAYGTAGDYGNSAAAFRRGLEMEPDSCLLRKGLALTFMNMRDYASAVSTLEGIPLEHRNGEVNALLDESRARRESGEWSGALHKD